MHQGKAIGGVGRPKTAAPATSATTRTAASAPGKQGASHKRKDASGGWDRTQDHVALAVYAGAAALVRLIEEKRKSGIFLSILGFGMGNYKDSKMEQLADPCCRASTSTMTPRMRANWARAIA